MNASDVLEGQGKQSGKIGLFSASSESAGTKRGLIAGVGPNWMDRHNEKPSGPAKKLGAEAPPDDR